MRVNVGDVVLAKYMNFDGEISFGLFAICYHECYDNPVSTNFTAIKVCTRSGCYQINLLKRSLPFLEHDSFLNCNMQFRFREDQVLKICGRLTPYYCNKMLQQVMNYNSAMNKQLQDLIGDDIFEDLKDRISNS